MSYNFQFSRIFVSVSASYSCMCFIGGNVMANLVVSILGWGRWSFSCEGDMFVEVSIGNVGVSKICLNGTQNAQPFNFQNNIYFFYR